MRFSLLSSLLLLTSACIAMAMWTIYGRWGVVFAVPHVLLMLVASSLLRRKWRYRAAALVGVYLALWIATPIYGARVIREDVERHAFAFVDAKYIPYHRLQESAAARDRHTRETRWLNVGAPTSPCPCIVTCDYSWRLGSAGAGGRTFAIVLPRTYRRFGYEPYSMD